MNGRITHDALSAYVLDGLDGPERAEFERHLASCAACRTELPDLEEAAGLLTLATPAAPLPTGMEGRTFVAVERAAAPVVELRPSRHRRPPLVAVGVAAAVAAAILLLVVRAGTPGLELEAVLAAPSGPAEASVDVRRTGIGRVVTFRSDSLPILPKGEYYELWFVGPGDEPGAPNRISAGTFHPDEQGRSHVTFAAAVDPHLYPVLSVTAEPGDGDPGPTGTEVLRSRP